MDRPTGAGAGRHIEPLRHVVPLALAATVAVFAAACDSGGDPAGEPATTTAPPTTAGEAGPYRYEIELRFEPGDPLHDDRGACWTVVVDGTAYDLSSTFEQADASTHLLGSVDDEGRTFECPAVGLAGPGPEFLAFETGTDLGDFVPVNVCVLNSPSRCTDTEARRRRTGPATTEFVAESLAGIDGEVWAIDGDGSLAEVYEQLAPISGFVEGTTLWLETACRPLGLETADGTITEFVEGTEIECDGPEQATAYDTLRTLTGSRIIHDDTSLTISTATGSLSFLRITDDDRIAILTMFAVDRATGRNGLGPSGTYDAVYVIDTVGQVDVTQADVHFEPDSPQLTPAERSAITTALEPLPVTYVKADWADTPTDIDGLDDDRAALVGLAAPQVTDRQVQIGSFVLCGSACGNGSLDILERDPDTTWRITGTRIDWEA